ncbi:isoleucine--tRNA ligase [Candidatus Kinetoplastibacterium sorsogonicusi]|nr:isoleucine--tRNA ligase [Candidatus Kinetoplastibacterium sorsogonicusi]
MDYKNTLNLTETPFPMKGDLPNKEPIIIKKWEEENIYNILSELNKNKPKFLLHDGPPYANGDIHLGHAVNKILKDIILKHKRLLGFNACYIPGWDCHGMPIEIQIEKKYGKYLPTIELQKKAREYALEQIEKQKKEFKRLGVLGQWDDPYLTMNFQNESDEVKVLSKILEYGYVNRGLKPVNWCFDCKSALAEAEIEYKDKLDYAIYVAFKFSNNNSILKKFGINFKNQFYGAIAIWTTTPWTIPANQALIINANIKYSLLKVNSSYNNHDLLLIVAKDLVENYLKTLSLKGEILSSIQGKELLGEEFYHPLYGTDIIYNRTAKIFHGDFVNIDNGTGIVHSAPAFGIEDFECFKSNGFTDDEIINPIDENGFFVNSLPFFGNMKIWEANEKIIQFLKTNNTLLFYEKYNHSYMHCWRHKSPLIFRSTHQWFVNMDIIPKNSNKSLRENALSALNNVKFYPEWGKSRLYSMIFNRPDWTISRQRQWGVPIPFFIHKKNGQLHPNTISIIKLICKKIEQYGISAWQNIDIQELLGNEVNEYEKSKDTLDVWFDSGSTNITVLGGKELASLKNLTWPADLYLEGSDQHRGWFHSSLLIGCMLYKQAPYKALLTHGFVVDGNGKKMSKSIGNVILPKEITNKFGAEILRLWVATTDYSGELYISDEILKRVVESYRRIRNTIRFLLANVSDFDPISDALQNDQLLEIDKYALLITKNLQNEIIQYYNKYEFHNVISKLQNFCSEDLGSFYLDILKDRLYTTKSNGKIRRSAQTALYNIALILLKLMSPILSFTTEEAWQYLLNNNYKQSKTIFIENYHEMNISDNANILHKWNQIRIIRKNVQNKLEKSRMTGAIGSSLQAEVEIYAKSNEKILLDSIGEELRFVFIVSKVTIKETDNDLKIVITPSNGIKCERCWNFCNHNDLHKEHQKICNRCFENIFGAGEIRYFS